MGISPCPLDVRHWVAAEEDRGVFNGGHAQLRPVASAALEPHRVIAKNGKDEEDCLHKHDFFSGSGLVLISPTI